MTWTNVKPLMNQKTLEDCLRDTKNPETLAMTLDQQLVANALQLVANAFTNMLVFLGKMQGIMGIPLAYVVRHILKGPNDADINNKTKDPTLGESGSPYFSIDNKLIVLAPILRHDLTYHQLSASLDTLESDGPF